MANQLKWYSFRWRTGVALLLVCAGMWWFMRGRFIHPVGRGPAGPPVSAEAFSSPWSDQKTILLGIGDSITSGYGATDGHCYFDLLVKNDDAAYPDMKGRDLTHVFPNLTAQNDAESYTVSQEHLDTQIKYLKKQATDVRGIVVLTTGGNDIIHDYGRSDPTDGAMYGCTEAQAVPWVASYQGRLRKIIEGITASFPGGCEIFIANVYDPTDGVGDIHHAHIILPKWRDGLKVLTLMNTTIAETAKEYPNVHLVDIHKEFQGHGIHCRQKRNPHYRKNDPNYWYFTNLEDPNDRGYDAIRRLFLLEMERVLRLVTTDSPP